MVMLTTQLPASRALRHFAAASSPWKRHSLIASVKAKRLAWHWLVAGHDRVKRLLDIAGSLAALIGLSPLFLFIAAAIKLEDRGPILFVQTRVGRHGRLFRMFKFRSMCLDADKRLETLLARNQHTQGITFKLKDDPRVTRIGKFLRRYSFDELPQFFNVLCGEMSLVGPRPPVPREVEKYTLADRRRLEVKPGITCIWQISGRATIDFSGQVKLDVQYIEQQSLGTDLRILARTVSAVVSGTGAY